jgi:hypothetical protein
MSVNEKVDEDAGAKRREGKDRKPSYGLVNMTSDAPRVQRVK